MRRRSASPEHAERMRALSIPITFRNAQAFAAYWAEEERVLRPLIAELTREGRSQ